jgi:hypothetical protein
LRVTTLRLLAFGLVAVVVGSSCTGSAEPVAAPPDFSQAFTITAVEGAREAVLAFEPGSSLYDGRSAVWILESWNGYSWNSDWVITQTVFRIEEWDDSSLDVGDVANIGPGPETLPLPNLSTDVAYRICNGAPGDVDRPSCALLPEPN